MPDQTMIERVARALCILAGRNPDTVDRLSGHHEHPRWHDYIEQAHTAITAMREPTEAMVSAGNKSKPYNVTGFCEGTIHPVVQRAWPAMIDAALEDGR